MNFQNDNTEELESENFTEDEKLQFDMLLEQSKCHSLN
jgi:hypothetical protein